MHPFAAADGIATSVAILLVPRLFSPVAAVEIQCYTDVVCRCCLYHLSFRGCSFLFCFRLSVRMHGCVTSI